MEALTQMKCVPCRGGEPTVTDAEVAELLKIGKSQQNARVQVYLSLLSQPKLFSVSTAVLSIPVPKTGHIPWDEV